MQHLVMATVECSLDNKKKKISPLREPTSDSFHALTCSRNNFGEIHTSQGLDPGRFPLRPFILSSHASQKKKEKKNECKQN